MCVQGSGTKECPSPAAAGHLPFPFLPRTAGPGQAPGRHGSAAQPARIPPRQRLLPLITSFSGVMGSLPPGGAAASGSQRAPGSSPGCAGEARPGPSADNNNEMHDIHTALPIISRGNRRDERHAALRQQEVPLQGSAASG